MDFCQYGCSWACEHRRREGAGHIRAGEPSAMDKHTTVPACTCDQTLGMLRCKAHWMPPVAPPRQDIQHVPDDCVDDWSYAAPPHLSGPPPKDTVLTTAMLDEAIAAISDGRTRKGAVPPEKTAASPNIMYVPERALRSWVLDGTGIPQALAENGKPEDVVRYLQNTRGQG